MGKRLLEAVPGGSNIVGHGDVTGAMEVVPFELQAEVLGATPVGGDGVQVA